MNESSRRKNGRCPDRAKFEQFFLDEMAQAEKERFLDHVLACLGCRKMFDVMSAIKIELEAKGEEVPERISPAEAAEWEKLATERLTHPTPTDRKQSKKFSFGQVLSLRFLAPAVSLVVLLTAGYLLFLHPTYHQDNLRFSNPGDLRLLSPQGHLSAPPSKFTWTRVRGIKKYYFEIIDDKLQLLFSTDVPRTETELALPEPVRSRLVRKVTYVWTVLAVDEKLFQLGSKSASFVLD